MGRTVDQDVHAAFVEFRAKGPYDSSLSPCLRVIAAAARPRLPSRADRRVEDDKCLSVQCIYCQQTRAKNTSRQKQHLLECPGLQNHPNAPRPQASPADANASTSSAIYGTPTGIGSSANAMTNGLGAPMQSTPLHTMPARPQIPPQGSAPRSATTTPLQQRPLATPKPQKTPKTSTPGSTLPAPPLDDVHAAFVEFRAKEEDKVRYASQPSNTETNDFPVFVCAMHLL
jgi:hypothetical protein